MNKTISAETRLNNIKSLCAERDRKEHERLRANRLDMERRKEAEKARVQNTNSIAADDFMNKHRRFLDKGREAVKRERNKTYFS